MSTSTSNNVSCVAQSMAVSEQSLQQMWLSSEYLHASDLVSFLEELRKYKYHQGIR